MQKILPFFKKHKTIVILTGILLLTLVLRVWGLNNNPFIADEFIDMNASYGYHQTGTWHAWDFNLEKPDVLDFYAARDERSWIYRWQAAQLFSFFAPTETTARSISVLWGTLTTLIIFWSARVFTKNTKIALLSAFLFAVAMTGIEYDRKLRMYAMFTPVFLLLSTFLFLFLEKYEFFKKSSSQKISPLSKKSTRFQTVLFLKKIFGEKIFGNNIFGVNFLYLLPVILIGLLSLHLQLLTVNIVFSLFGYFLAIAILSSFFPKKVSCSLSAKWGLSVFILALPIIYFFFPEILLSISGTSRLFMDNYAYLAKMFGDFQHPLLGMLSVFFGFFTLLVTMKKPKQALWLLTAFLIPLLLTIFIWKRAQGTQYIFYLEPFVLILSATGVVGFVKWLQKSISTLPKKTISLFVFTLALILLPNYGSFFESQNTYHRGNDPVADYRKVFTYLTKIHTPGDALITRNFRNYYFAKWHAPVLEFGGERADHNLTQEEIQNFICAHPSGFVVIFDNDWDFVTKDGRTFVETRLAKIDHSSVRGASEAWQWGADTVQKSECEK